MYFHRFHWPDLKKRISPYGCRVSLPSRIILALKFPPNIFLNLDKILSRVVTRMYHFVLQAAVGMIKLANGKNASVFPLQLLVVFWQL